MLCSINPKYYRWYFSKELKTAVAHSDAKYQCKKSSDCPYTGTIVINKEPWGERLALKEDVKTEESEELDQAE